MIYLLDANIFITSKNLYYEFGRVDQYWEWLVFQAEQRHVKVPIEIYEEISIGTDELSSWAKANKAELILDEEVDVDLVQRVTTRGSVSL